MPFPKNCGRSTRSGHLTLITNTIVITIISKRSLQIGRFIFRCINPALYSELPGYVIGSAVFGGFCGGMELVGMGEGGVVGGDTERIEVGFEVGFDGGK